MLQDQHGRVPLLTWVAAMFDLRDLTACILFSSNSLFCCSFSASFWCILNETRTITKHVNTHTQQREERKSALTTWDWNLQELSNTEGNYNSERCFILSNHEPLSCHTTSSVSFIRTSTCHSMYINRYKSYYNNTDFNINTWPFWRNKTRQEWRADREIRQ